ncbi:MAG: sensor histidine kinase [Ruminococcaceae bacterium]|nr:sensor histidine kinase [Oscillospiraceae bacterium]
MLQNNKELCRGIAILAGATVILTAIGFSVSAACGILVLFACVAVGAIHVGTEVYRYRRLQKLSTDLDRLLISGVPLPIADYNEGELSILANQVQKLTLRLTEAAEAVEADKKYLADSLADISHQLRTPLTAMTLTTTMLRTTELTDEKRMELTGELRSLLARTDWLVETLLKISKLDAGTVKLAKDTVSVKELISRSAAPIAIPMELRNQTLVVKCDKESFSGDLIWSAEALGNILKNCIEHTPEGGTITVTAQETALYTQIEVEDTGSGFDPKDIPHLFERFYKGSNASQNSYGIGLALARTVITAQNGTVQAMNGNTGAKFVIKFYKQVI